MARGKSINLFLMDDTVTGRIKCTIANWIGVGFKIPCADLDKCQDRPELRQSGIYFLFGTSGQTGNPFIYVGQAGAKKSGEGLLTRLMENKRNSQMDFWTEAIVLTTASKAFGSSEICYLANHFYKLALDAKRYDVKRDGYLPSGELTEEKASEMEEFIDYSKLVVGVLGHKTFEPIVEPGSVIKKDKHVLYMNHGAAKATGVRTRDGFVVLKNSKISPTTTKSCPDYALKLRKQYAYKINDAHILTDDILFSSPSTAAEFVGGSSLNGRVCWRDAQGHTLRELEEKG